MAARYVSKKNESVRMFENKLLEFCSHVHPAVPLVIYLPVIAFMFYLAIWEREIALGAVTGFFLLGVLAWTLLEYIIHRYAFHYEPRSSWGKRLHFMMHGVHHDYPNDASRLVMPPSVSVPLAFVFYGMFLILFGRYTPAAFAGLIFGYLCYDMIHYATHHFSMKNRVWQRLKQYHLLHHYKDDHIGFGVSSPLWDFVFGTRRR
jgi:4-hydroxysphinganine ceramide fatty acyl 2-hydroxylase